MNRLAIRLSMLTVCATALAVVPVVAAAKAGTARKQVHTRMHKRHWTQYYGAALPVAPPQPVVGAYRPTEPVCPAIGRSFDCKIWPPPFADDPDRKTSRY